MPEFTTDAMECRACGKEERASEGYPCQNCSTFICNLCNMRGIVLCKRCEGADTAPRPIAKPKT
jgi:hypothetical protein